MAPNDENSSHVYAREVDANKNDFKVNEAVVNDLIRERTKARTQKQFGKSDAILAELLRDHGVVLNDSHKTWKTATKKELKKLKQQQQQKGAPQFRYRQDYAVSCQAGPHTSPLSETEILGLIAQRRQARSNRDYATSDAILNDLKRAGVYVEDDLKEYRADGVPFRTTTRSSSSQAGEQLGHTSRTPQKTTQPLAKSAYSQDLEDDDDEAIVLDLLEQRSRFKSQGRFEQADQLRDRLFETYNIRIDDRLGEWSVGGDFGDDTSHWARQSDAKRLAYTKSPSSVPLPPDEEAYIQQRVDQRMRAKRTRNYELSDAIRDELLAEYDVTIHDKINQWSVGGDFGPDHSWKHVGHNDNNQEEPIKTRSIASIIESGRRAPARESRSDLDNHSKVSDLEEENDVPPPPIETSVAEEENAGLVQSATQEELASLTVVQLKEKLRQAGQKVSGKKEELVQRLLLLN